MSSGEDMIIICEEREEDKEAVRAVNENAFGQPAEADIVDRLRENCPGLLSLVALEGDEIVGHLSFSPRKNHRRRNDHSRQWNWKFANLPPQETACPYK